MAWLPPSPALSSVSAASWVEIDSPWEVDWDVVSDFGHSPPDLATTSAVTLDLLSVEDFPPLSRSRHVKTNKSRKRVTSEDVAPRLRHYSQVPVLLDGNSEVDSDYNDDHYAGEEIYSNAVYVSGDTTLAELGIGMRNSGRRCGLAVIRAHDVSLPVQSRCGGKGGRWGGGPYSQGYRRNTTCSLLWAPVTIDFSPPRRRKLYYDRDGNGWAKRVQSMWDRHRNRRYPRDMDVKVSTWVGRGLSRCFEARWSSGSAAEADGIAATLYSYTGDPKRGEPLNVAWWKEMTTAATLEVAVRFIRDPFQYATGTRSLVCDRQRIRRLINHPTERLEQERAKDERSALFLRSEDLAWLFGYFDQLDYSDSFTHRGTYLYCRAVELEIRAFNLWTKAKHANDVTEEWTPYGQIGETYHSEPVPGCLRGEYLSEPLPETRLVRLLGQVTGRQHDRWGWQRGWQWTLTEWVAACGPDVWRTLRHGHALERYVPPGWL